MVWEVDRDEWNESMEWMSSDSLANGDSQPNEQAVMV